MCVFDDVKNITNSKITRFNHDENGGLMKTDDDVKNITNSKINRFDDDDNGGSSEKFLQR